MGGSRRVPVAGARASLKRLVERVKEKGERVRLTRYGKTQAIIVPVEDVTLLEECQEELQDCAKRRAVGGRRK